MYQVQELKQNENGDEERNWENRKHRKEEAALRKLETPPKTRHQTHNHKAFWIQVGIEVKQSRCLTKQTPKNSKETKTTKHETIKNDCLSGIFFSGCHGCRLDVTRSVGCSVPSCPGCLTLTATVPREQQIKAPKNSFMLKLCSKVPSAKLQLQLQTFFIYFCRCLFL